MTAHGRTPIIIIISLLNRAIIHERPRPCYVHLDGRSFRPPSSATARESAKASPDTEQASPDTDAEQTRRASAPSPSSPSAASSSANAILWQFLWRGLPHRLSRRRRRWRRWRRDRLQRRPGAPRRKAVRAKGVFGGDAGEGPDPGVHAQGRGEVPLHVCDRVRGQSRRAVQRKFREKVPNYLQEGGRLRQSEKVLQASGECMREQPLIISMSTEACPT